MSKQTKRIGVYPGSFDPVTLGHLDLIERASGLVDKLVVGVLCNSAKTAFFTTEERVELLKQACAHLKNVEVKAFDGLLVDFLRQEGASVSFRGLRSGADFEAEIQMAQANKTVCPEMETVFLGTSPELSFVSSTIVRDLIRYGADISRFVPACVLETINQFRRKQ